MKEIRHDFSVKNCFEIGCVGKLLRDTFTTDYPVCKVELGRTRERLPVMVFHTGMRSSFLNQ